MFDLDMPELMATFIVLLIVFGSGKLPEIGSEIGKGKKSFKKAVREASQETSLPVKPADTVAERRQSMKILGAIFLRWIRSNICSHY
jgi:sec-independent protein translocase protein TatA